MCSDASFTSLALNATTRAIEIKLQISKKSQKQKRDGKLSLFGTWTININAFSLTPYYENYNLTFDGAACVGHPLRNKEVPTDRVLIFIFEVGPRILRCSLNHVFAAAVENRNFFPTSKLLLRKKRKGESLKICNKAQVCGILISTFVYPNVHAHVSFIITFFSFSAHI